MKLKTKSKVIPVIDPSLIARDHTAMLSRVFQEEKIKFSTQMSEVDPVSPTLFFVEHKNLRKISHFKNKIIVVPQTEHQSQLSVHQLNLNSYEEIHSFMNSFFQAEKRIALQERIKESFSVYDEMKKHLDLSARDNLPIDLSRAYEGLLDLEIALLKEENTQRWNDHFKTFTKKVPANLSSMALIKNDQLLQEDLVIDENLLILKLASLDDFLVMRFKNFEAAKDAPLVELILSMIHRMINIADQKLIKSDGEVDFWKKIFSKIPYPMAVISSLGDLLIYNESFAKIGLLPKECQRFKDQESVELYQHFYKVRRIDFPINLIDVSYFVFYTADKDQIQKVGEKVSKKSTTIDDLGIISSSIAHELNNPLAGILAALSLLSLEDDWSPDAISDLEDMKNGAKRCKELIDIFLGFSKFSPASGVLPSIKDSLDQAINLLRFRMIESNLRLEMRYSPTLERFSHQMNASIMSMILYLICSELMTAFAHHRLINQNQQGQLSGDVLEFSNQIIIRLDHDFEYEDKIAQSKLIQHLLIFEKLEINFLKQELRLIYRS